MKKLLLLLTSVTMTCASVATVTSCSFSTKFEWIPKNPSEPEDENTDEDKKQNFLSVEEIKKSVEHIQDFESIFEVNSELGNISIQGIKNLYAEIIEEIETDAKICFDLEENWIIEEGVNHFILVGAIKPTPLIVVEQATIISATSNIKNLTDLTAVNNQLLAVQVSGVKSLIATLISGSETDVNVEIVLHKGYILDVSETSFEIQGAIKAKVVLKIEDIISSTNHIRNLFDIASVQTQLNYVSIEGVKSLTATSIPNSETDVNVTIALNTGYILDVSETSFEIQGAIKAKVVLKIEDIISSTSHVKNLLNLTVVQNQLNAIDFTGVESLTASMIPDSETDVKVFIEVETGYVLDSSINSFEIKGAIREKDIVRTSDIIAQTANIKYLENISAVQAELNKISITGLKKLTATVNSSNNTSVNVYIEIDSEIAILEGSSSFTISKALAIVVKSSDVQIATRSINNKQNLEAVQNALDNIEIEGVDFLSAEMVDGSETDVQITIYVSDKAVLEGSSTFILQNAVVITVNTDDIIAATSHIVAFSNLAAVQAEVKSLKFVGVQNLVVMFDGSSRTNVRVNITLANNAVINGASSFVISKAVKVDVNTSSIISRASSIKNQSSLQAYSEALKATSVEGVLDYDISFLEDSKTDIRVVILADVNGTLVGQTSVDVVSAVSRPSVPSTSASTVSHLEQLIRDAGIHFSYNMNLLNGVLLRQFVSLHDVTGRIILQSQTPNSTSDLGIVSITFPSVSFGRRIVLSYYRASTFNGSPGWFTTTLHEAVGNVLT